MKQEIWKDIDGYDGAYQVSTYGRVRSFTSRFGRKVQEPHILPQSLSNRGYLQVVLSKNHYYKKHNVHRLVALAFIPNPDNLSDTNHIDEDKLDNHVDNLEWMSHKDNCNYGTRGQKISEAHKRRRALL